LIDGSDAGSLHGMPTNAHKTQLASVPPAVRSLIWIDFDLRDLEINEEEILADLLYPWIR
jgi:hypothetical protein